jgi:sugar lactone lactonase YvrE
MSKENKKGKKKKIKGKDSIDEQPQDEVIAEEDKPNYEVICHTSNKPFCPIEDHEGNLFVVVVNGDIYQVTDNRLELAFSTNGQPTGIVFDQQGTSFVADCAHQAILNQIVNEHGIETSPVIKDFEGSPLKGPHSMILSEKQNALFFTDSGPFGETGLENPTGSIFAVDLTESLLKKIQIDSLAYPTGLAVNISEDVLYVCETCRNRVLKVVLHENGTYHTSVFKQFSGRFGPTAIAVNHDGSIYVARFDFSYISDYGLISVLNEKAELEDEIKLPKLPEITGLYFSKLHENLLYITEASNQVLASYRLE